VNRRLHSKPLSRARGTDPGSTLIGHSIIGWGMMTCPCHSPWSNQPPLANAEIQTGGNRCYWSLKPPRSLNCALDDSDSRRGLMPPQPGFEPGASTTGIGSISPNGCLPSGESTSIAMSHSCRHLQGRAANGARASRGVAAHCTGLRLNCRNQAFTLRTPLPPVAPEFAGSARFRPRTM